MKNVFAKTTYDMTPENGNVRFLLSTFMITRKQCNKLNKELF